MILCNLNKFERAYFIKMIKLQYYITFDIEYTFSQQNMMTRTKLQGRKLVTFKIGEVKVQYDIYTHWSINKIKCLLVNEFSKLKFDQFQLMHTGRLLNGTTKLVQITSQYNDLTLIVTNVKSNTKFDQYYKDIMKVYLQAYRNENEPIMDEKYQHTIKNMQVLQKRQDSHVFIGANANQADNADNQNRIQVPHIFQVLRWIGLGLFLMMMLLRGAPYQIAILIAIICSHYLIQFFKVRNAKNPAPHNNQNPVINNQKQNLQQNQRNIWLNTLKAELLLRFYKSIEIIYCFVLTFYPNWDLTLHYNTNQQRLIHWRNRINQLRPGTYPSRNKIE